MIELTAHEGRLLGVLIEKSLTTPDQYPLSPNAAAAGANQKNNRDPVLSLSDDEVFDALESLRGKKLAVRVDQAGGRVHKYRHTATDALHVRTGELAVLAELLNRGPQTVGELRGRALRMSPMDSIEVMQSLMRALSDRPEPLVKQVPPSPGSRAERYAQLLCPALHPVGATAENVPTAGSPTFAASGVAERVTQLELQVAELRTRLDTLAAALGETVERAT